MSDNGFCDKPDRDFPPGHRYYGKIKCGYPLPCPYHTIVIDMTDAPTTTIPPNANIDKNTREKISEIVNVLKKED